MAYIHCSLTRLSSLFCFQFKEKHYGASGSQYTPSRLLKSVSIDLLQGLFSSSTMHSTNDTKLIVIAKMWHRGYVKCATWILKWTLTITIDVTGARHEESSKQGENIMSDVWWSTWFSSRKNERKKERQNKHTRTKSRNLALWSILFVCHVPIKHIFFFVYILFCSSMREKWMSKVNHDLYMCFFFVWIIDVSSFCAMSWKT